MDKGFTCECGNDKFWFFWHYVRCTKCYNEYKDEITNEVAAGYESERFMRRFNKEENKYDNNWEKAPITFRN